MLATVAHLLNFALALVFWLILGRLVLTLLAGGRRNFFTGIFEKGTEPAYAAVRVLTRGAISDRYVWAPALVLVLALRLALFPLMT